MTKVTGQKKMQVPSGDLAAKRIDNLGKIGHFKNEGKGVKGAGWFGSAKPRASKEGNNPS